MNSSTITIYIMLHSLLSKHININTVTIQLLLQDNPLGWNYVIDGNFLPAFPRDLAANRENIPILIGTNHDEWALWGKIY
jgi:hypothetical protein